MKEFKVNDKVSYPLQDMYNTLIAQLHKRGIDERDLAQAAYEQQAKYGIPYTLEDFVSFTNHVLHNVNVLNLAITGLSIDDNANGGNLPLTLSTVLRADMTCYAVDEVIAMAIANTYSPIGVTNFGNADCHKTAIAKKLDEQSNTINVFADDIINGIIGAIVGYVVNRLATGPLKNY